ncbi:hypothetical protein NEMBOFW57_001263 [Staphylotrichum longicolle]|uniref:Uncharacterized protein n=1 Tax=Staphylotrichum longicolle TaxID=669026 RepID=A0AAD4F0U7_9PEZI|nr:hypothetical protein NEMBOFW57_001263 [Staphylotrichum longicolle]
MPDGDESNPYHWGAIRDKEQMDGDGDSDSDSDGETEDVSFSSSEPALTPRHKHAQHEAWLPFARFLRRLTGLKDFVYSCAQHLPACVLAALHRHHRRSRLHVRAFSLRSLYHERNQLPDIDPDELALATSPCLYSIHATCGAGSFNLEALDHMIMGSAPGLRRVRIGVYTRGGCLALLESIHAPQKPWQGFYAGPGTADSARQPPTQPAKGRLESLVLSDPFASPGVNAWNNRTDLTLLRRLDLRINSVATINALTALAADNRLRSLQALALSISFPYNPQRNAVVLGHQASDHPTSLLLQALPPLRSLRLTGYFGAATVDAILHRHGPALRKLFLLPNQTDNTSDALLTPRFFRNDNNDNPAPDDPNVPAAVSRPHPEHTPLIHALAAHCPHLTTLTLRIHRHHGRRPEVAAYRALRQLRNLRRATLHLDCRLPASMSPDVDGNEAETVRQVWMNCAVDRALARTIFEVVNGGDKRLERLRLRPEVPSGMLDRLRRAYHNVADWVGESWVCEEVEGSEEGGVKVRGVATMDVLSMLDSQAGMEELDEELFRSRMIDDT